MVIQSFSDDCPYAEEAAWIGGGIRGGDCNFGRTRVNQRLHARKKVRASHNRKRAKPRAKK